MDRPLRLAKWYADNQTSRHERRGGSRNDDNETSRPERRGRSRNDDKWKERKLLISEHIQSFTYRASHCARRGSPGRKYMSSDLSVANMHSMFQE